MSDIFTFDKQQLELIKKTYAKDCTDDEFLLFIQIAQRTGLDPFSRQIYAIKRAGKMVVQTSIDGYRLIADRGGNYAGNDEAVFFHNEAGLLVRATVKVWKFVKGVRCDFTGTAMWDEYVQTDGKGDVTKMWADKPYIMLSKCAEAQSLRKAFPADLSGLYTHEEMMQADNAPVVITQPALEEPRPKATTKPLKDLPLNEYVAGGGTGKPSTVEKYKASKAEDMEEALLDDEIKSLRLPDRMGTVPGGVTPEQLAKIVALKKAAKFTPEESLQWGLMVQSEYSVKGPKDLTSEQADTIILDLQQLGGK